MPGLLRRIGLLPVVLAASGCNGYCVEEGAHFNLTTIAYEAGAERLHLGGRAAMSHCSSSDLDRPDRYRGLQVALDLTTLEHQVKKKDTYNRPRVDLPAGAEVLFSGSFLGGGANDDLELVLPDGRHVVRCRDGYSVGDEYAEREVYPLVLVEVFDGDELRVAFSFGHGSVQRVDPE